ncbi:MAG: hypothetical protein EU549_00945 [Promethearchaeota archaeon]|nr:MAG: hypothetical protein EU549_00945 [Candidatus Lokiarchaeota archaeon]
MVVNEDIRSETLKIMTKYGFWAIYKEYMQGVAGYIRSKNSKLYCEILFPKNYPKQKAIFKFPKRVSSKIMQKYVEISKRENATPFRIINELKPIIKDLPPYGVILEEQLDAEIERIKIYYTVSYSKDKYLLKVKFESPKSFYYSVELDLHNYPKSIKLTFSKDLEKILGKPTSLDLIKNWDRRNPLDILEIIDYINKSIRNHRESITNDQKISINNLNIVSNDSKIIKDLTFHILSGELVGIYSENSEIIDQFFKCFTGQQSYTGEIRIFDKDIRKSNLNIFYLDFTKNQIYELFNIDTNVNIKKAFKTIKDAKRNSKIIDNIISIVQLDTIKKTKIRSLNKSQIYRLVLGLSVISIPDLILINKPEFDLNDTEQKKIWRIIKELNEEYYITAIIYSETSYIQNSNIILQIHQGELIDFGTHDKLISLLPTTEIIVLQLNQHTKQDIKNIQNIDGIKFIIEERKDEKYRIFTGHNSSQIIKTLFKELGDKIFNLSKEKPGLIDVIPYLRYKKRIS